MKILLAEDDLLQRKVLTRLMSRAGHDVRAVSGGAEALEQLIGGEFNLLVTDWDMPGMDGATLCREVRAAQLPDYVYILMLTGHTSEADLLAAFDAGADDFVRKPASEPELLARVRAAVRLLESERSLKAALAQVRTLSILDPLTGAYNRRYLSEQLEREVERSRRSNRPLALILADIDHFKRINDAHGHAAGDAALKCFVERLQTGLRTGTDWIARYGGEEFAVVLPETAIDQALIVAERLRSACADQAMPLSAGAATMSASFGVASLDPTTLREALVTSAAENLLRSADAGLYRSKHAGRNCVHSDR